MSSKVGEVVGGDKNATGRIGLHTFFLLFRRRSITLFQIKAEHAPGLPLRLMD